MKTPESAEHKRKRIAFQGWLRKNYACAEGRRFVRGKTAREFWLSCTTKQHQEWMCWFLTSTQLQCCDDCVCSVPGGPAAVRKLVKLPRTFEWEKVERKSA
jgi:hypothetical protein